MNFSDVRRVHRLIGAEGFVVVVSIFVIVVLFRSEGRQCFHDVAKVKVDEKKTNQFRTCESHC